MGKRASTKLNAFTDEQLAALATDYPTIRREVNRLAIAGLTDVKLPVAKSVKQRLTLLRDLEASEDLWIRISYAGNLNVLVREGADLADQADADGIGYVTVLRRPATDWCVPRGRYVP